MRRTVVGLLLLALAACEGGAFGDRPAIPVDGDPQAGRRAIAEVGCGSCHRIPGITEADALVGPPLDAWSGRAFIAGVLPNSPDNLATFIRDPDSVSPGTAMPDLELDDETIASIVAYLYTLD